MRSAALPLLCLALAACTHAPRAVEAPPAPVEQHASPAEPEPRAPSTPASIAKPECKRLDRELLRGAVAAQGAMVQVFSVAELRGRQVEQLTNQLARIAAALTKGCVE